MTKTKDKIIQKSMEFISKYGYANFSIGNIAKELHISKGVVNYHFPQKELLLKIIITQFYEKAVIYMSEHMKMNTNAKSTLESYIESNLRFVSENKSETLALTEIVLNARNEDGQLIFMDEDKSVFKPLIEIFEYGQDVDGSFRKFSPEIMARAVRSVIDNFSSVIAKDEITDVDSVINDIKTIFNKATEKGN
ncbi:TPA: TetR/AcrR family transcriptional regulator [Bacillus cereus]|uniref:TetR/AcrR family transcriptional regulator n=1 Tax=Bacillus TaxID=1386 RepID=UPI000BED9D6F|nr:MULTISPECIES: TetR/AcrR family transcriptional regulator [Bacillus cereus group]MEB9948152.1 TetR/AcrR family transcriptional regulator [Bacillus cereus]PDZ20971.1 TetR family transcriptional regulator [Bacillus cereus]PDZ54316.1 TetR family transcriptional regulator [Bacillus cereus]PEC73073.1 TetR family transcriptional regulator [Bacillus thuringiensis]PEC99877.1 TetR family transcriptional regulator [Bacillus cereus]